MLIPYEVDVPFERTPWMNWLLVASIGAVFVLQFMFMIQAPEISGDDMGPFEPWVLRRFNLEQLVGHMWLHADIIHVIGNLIFLWVFGNAVCQKIGNGKYIPIYLVLGLIAAMASLLFTAHPERGMIGASGAINGIVGMYLILYPRNDIWMFYWWGFYWHGTFEISGYWMILMWLVFDILGAVYGGGNTAYFAHLGGFAAGAAGAVALLLTRCVVMDEKDEESLLDLIRETFKPKPVAEPVRETALGDDDVLAAYRLIKPGKGEPDLVGKVLPRVSGKSARQIQGGDIVAEGVEKSDKPIRFQSENSSPVPNGFIRYRCSCGKRFKSHPALAGRSGVCPECNKVIVIPKGPIR